MCKKQEHIPRWMRNTVNECCVVAPSVGVMDVKGITEWRIIYSRVRGWGDKNRVKYCPHFLNNTNNTS